jgi:transcription elongation factor Elf1
MDDMDKKAMREEAERLMREAMANRNVTVKQGDTVIMATCGKCGAPNKVKAPKGVTRVAYTCKECGAKQETL